MSDVTKNKTRSTNYYEAFNLLYKGVIDKNDFIKVILTPFLSITLICTALFFIVDHHSKILLLGLFLTHTVFCSGDFGLLAYIIHKGEKDIYTYDDKETGKSYFYEKVKD